MGARRGTIRSILALLTVGAVVGVLAGARSDPNEDRQIVESDVDGAAEIAGPPIVLHSPPRVAELGSEVEVEYSVVCPSSDWASAGTCAADVALHIVAPTGVISTHLIETAPGHFVATIPPSLIAPSVEYFATISYPALGIEQRAPVDGNERIFFVSRYEEVFVPKQDLNSAPAPPSAILLAGAWGGDVGKFGLSAVTDGDREGPRAFAIAPSGDIAILDSVNARIQTFGAGQYGSGSVIPLEAQYGIPVDIEFSVEGELFLLTALELEPAILKFSPADDGTFLPDGKPSPPMSLEGIVPEFLQRTEAGVFAHIQPGDRWVPVSASGYPSSMPSLPLGGDLHRIVKGSLHQLLVVLIQGEEVEVAWRISFEDYLGDIHAVIPRGRTLQLLVRLWQEDPARDQFHWIQIRDREVRDLLAIPSNSWADASPFSIFGVSDPHIFQLQRGEEGVRVARYDTVE